MAYLGRPAPEFLFDAFVKNTFDGDGSTTAFTLTKSPGSVNSLLVSVDNVIQEPGVAFTVSGSTLTLTEAPDTGSDNIYAVFWGGTLTISETSTVKTSNSATITGNLVPTSNVVFSLGEPASTWKELYLDANSLHLGNTSVSIGKTGEVEFMKTNKLGQPVINRDIANVHASIDAGGVLSFYSANTTGNVRFARGAAIGYANSKVPGANLDVHGNAYISGATRVAGALTLGTQLAVAQGGTGATSLTDGGVLLGSGTGAVTAMTALGDGELIVGDGATDPVAESGDTLRISIGVGTTASGTVMQIYSANTTGNVSLGRGLAVGYVGEKVPGANLDVNGNTYISGATTLATSLGIGTSLTGHSNPQLEIVKSAQAHVRVAGVIGGTGQTTAGTNSYQNTAPQFDFADAQNWRITLANNVTFGRPLNCNEGTTGSIFVLQDGTGSRTGSFSSDWLFAAGEAPTLTTTASANDRIDYIVQKVQHGGQAVGIQAVVTLDLK